jgi:hypothetical protein
MNTALRQHATQDENVFHFVSTHQSTNDRRGCSRVRELARLWWKLHTSVSDTITSATSSYAVAPQNVA